MAISFMGEHDERSPLIDDEKIAGSLSAPAEYD
jgi:hypothetical protein